MALTYLPNANEVRDQSGRSPLPFVAAAIIAVALLGAGSVLLSSSGSEDTTAAVVTRTDAGAKPAVRDVATYGTPGEYFKAAFATTPLAAADTGGLVVNFPVGSSVSGYAVTASPKAVYEDNDVVPLAPTFAVLTATLPTGVTADEYLAVIADASYLKPVTVDGVKGYQYVGPVTGEINKGLKDLDRKAQENVMFLAKGTSAYIVAAINEDAAKSAAFVASFHPVKDSAVPVPLTGAR